MRIIVATLLLLATLAHAQDYEFVAVPKGTDVSKLFGPVWVGTATGTLDLSGNFVTNGGSGHFASLYVGGNPVLTNDIGSHDIYLLTNGTRAMAGPLNLAGNPVTNVGTLTATGLAVSGTATLPTIALGGETRTNWAPYVCSVGWTNNYSGLAAPYILTNSQFTIIPMNEKTLRGCSDPYGIWGTTNGTIPVSGSWTVGLSMLLYRTNSSTAARSIMFLTTNGTTAGSWTAQVEDSMAVGQSYLGIFGTRTMRFDAGTKLWVYGLPVGDNQQLIDAGTSPDGALAASISLKYEGK